MQFQMGQDPNQVHCMPTLSFLVYEGPEVVWLLWRRIQSCSISGPCTPMREAWLVEGPQTAKLGVHEIQVEHQGVLGLPTYHGQQGEINNNSHQWKGISRLNCSVNHHSLCPTPEEVSCLPLSLYLFGLTSACQLNISLGHWPRLLGCRIPIYHIRWPVVNKDGDLELYAIYDTPKQPIWGARGDLAIGAGVGLKAIESYQNITLADEFSLESADLTRSIFKWTKSPVQYQIQR